MRIYQHPSPADWPSLVARPVQSFESISEKVKPILESVRLEGDAALRRFTKQFDGIDLSEVIVSEEEKNAALSILDGKLQQAIDQAYSNIRTFHLKQVAPPEKVETMPGVQCWRKSVAIEKVGIYIPGGSAPLFSTVLMLGVPAQIAGCNQIVLCTPAAKDGTVHPAIMYAAKLCGVQQIVKVGGAQAIAALAYGTESVPNVYKIFGPGNQYVTAAKQIVSSYGVAIDMPAGPSEVLVLADHTAQPDFVAADLYSQAEHGPDSQVVLVTTDATLLPKVEQALEKIIKQLSRGDVANQALQNSSMIVLSTSDQAIAFSNLYAPEHLILAVEDPEWYAERVINAGSVFLGHYTPESAGDYASGTNHTLPTNGYARAYSGVSLDSFVKKITFQKISKDGLSTLGPVVETMAESELLTGHKYAVSVRLKTS